MGVHFLNKMIVNFHTFHIINVVQLWIMCAITTQYNQLQLPHVSTFELGMGTFINQPPETLSKHCGY